MSVLGKAWLVTGTEEFLISREIQNWRGKMLATVPGIELSDISALGLQVGDLAAEFSPSLFSEDKAIVLRDLAEISEDVAEYLLEFLKNPEPNIAVLLCHSGGPKGSGLLKKLRTAGVAERKIAAFKGREWANFVATEFRNNQQQRVAVDAIDYLIQSVGQDSRALAAAVAQLAADAGEQPVTLGLVKEYFSGRAEAKSFQIADLTLAGKLASALTELRWALDLGTPPVLVTSAMASGARALAKYKMAPGKMNDEALSKQIGVPPWKLRDLRTQAKGWDEVGLAKAITLIATADADIKGQASDANYALERLVISIVAARSK